MEIGSVHITEPLMVATDLLNSILCIYFYIKLYKNEYRFEKNKLFYWMQFFFFLGISSMLGTVLHSVPKNLQNPYFLNAWLTMQTMTCFSVYFAQKAALVSFYPPSPKKEIAKKIVLWQLILFIFACIMLKNYWVVKINLILGISMVIYLHFKFQKTEINNSRKIAVGLSISYLAAFVHSGKWSPFGWIDYGSLSHLVISVSLILTYAGVMLDAAQPHLRSTHVSS